MATKQEREKVKAMKNILYGTTALVAVSLLAGTAGAAEKIKLGLGGYWRGVIQIGDNESDASPATLDNRGHGLGQESEIYFSGKTTLDNGIKFGVMVQLEGETSGDQIDNTYIWADGSFGRVEFGETWGVSLLMSAGSIGELIDGHGDFGSQGSVTTLNGLGLNSYGGDAGILQTPDQKIQYFTPRMSGFQLGVSYMPENNTGNNSTGSGLNSQLDGTVGNELLDVAANYVGKMGGTDVRVFGSRFVSDTEATAVGAAAGTDVDGYSAGGQIGMSGFRIGGRYTKIDDRAGAANTDRVEWRAGVDYASGPYKVGIVYQLATGDVAAVVRDDETRYVSVGGSYNLGPGIKLFGGLQFFDFEDSSNTAATQGSNTVGVIGTKFSF
ncbi:MAG: porin [Alphaproteobacteria bacterium]|nr:porin [Alphaproteobacteria bacterium]MBL6951975.1 porin [Alphaproteobacteria bacterium]